MRETKEGGVEDEEGGLLIMDCRWLEKEKDGHGEVGSTCTEREREKLVHVFNLTALNLIM